MPLPVMPCGKLVDVKF